MANDLLITMKISKIKKKKKTKRPDFEISITNRHYDFENVETWYKIIFKICRYSNILKIGISSIGLNIRVKKIAQYLVK